MLMSFSQAKYSIQKIKNTREQLMKLIIQEALNGKITIGHYPPYELADSCELLTNK